MITYARKGLEFRFYIPGKPESFRVPAAKVFKQRVKDTARSVFKTPLAEEAIEIRLDHFCRTTRRSDQDNVAKAVIDALSGVAYRDDRQVAMQSMARHDLRNAVILRNHPIDVVKPLKDHDEYLFVRLRIVDH